MYPIHDKYPLHDKYLIHCMYPIHDKYPKQGISLWYVMSYLKFCFIKTA